MARLSLLGLLRAVQQWSASKALSPTPGRSYESGDANRYRSAKEYAANFIRSSSSLPKFLCRWAPEGKQPRSCSLDCSDRLVQRMAPIACTTFVSEATRFVSETSVTCPLNLNLWMRQPIPACDPHLPVVPLVFLRIRQIAIIHASSKFVRGIPVQAYD